MTVLYVLHLIDLAIFGQETIIRVTDSGMLQLGRKELVNVILRNVYLL